ncbi:Kdm2 [Symbiodinium microadriaticum]|nr:Kdm2 [Symbiodinium microadriaticum]
MISLEVSSTPLASHILSPRFVRQLDWIDAYWPVDRRARGRDFPSVQKYVLCGMKGSYTDFHVDFGGTSVWYHVLFGQKDFILAPPTMRNFAAYRKWTKSCDQDNIFFSDIIGSENCRRISIRAGQTLLIPGGWIHGVYTPVDSLVVGGNFLLDLCILPQLQTYAVEQDIHVTKKYSFPCFKQMVWYVLCGCLRLIPGLPGSRFPSVQERSPPFTCARVLWQWPYLLKTCADWIQSDSLGRVDAEVISQEALKCGHTTMVAASELSQSIDEKSVGYPMGVIDEWWDIMTRSDRHPVAAPRDCSFGNVSFLEHVSYVRSILSFNALDEPLYATYPVEFATFKTDPYCAADESGQLEESFSYFDGASAAIREDMAAVLPINGDDDRKPGVEHQSQNGSCNVLDSRSLVNIKTDISVDVFGATASSHLSQKIIIPTKRHMNTDVEDHSARKK